MVYGLSFIQVRCIEAKFISKKLIYPGNCSVNKFNNYFDAVAY